MKHKQSCIMLFTIRLCLEGLLAVCLVAAWGFHETVPAGDSPVNTPGVMGLVGEDAIRDSAGRVVCTKKPFTRIISLYSAHTENLFFLGLSDEIIGVSRIDASMAKAAGKKTFSPQNSPERFIAAAPDLVIVRPMLDHGYPRLMEQLDRFGIQVVSLQPADVDEMLIYWRILGRLSGREARGVGMGCRFKIGVAEARHIAEAVPSRKTVYFEAIHNRFKTFSPGSMPIFALETAGGINGAEDARPSRGSNIANFGKEPLLARGEEIDVYLAQDGHMNRPSIKAIMNVPGYTVIRAVREGNIFLVDEEIVSRPTPRLLEGIAAIGGILYPEQFTENANKRILRHGPNQDH